MMIETVRGKVRPTMAAAFPPLAINIEKQHTAEEPCHSLYRFADQQLLNDKLLINSIVLGFPYADVAGDGLERDRGDRRRPGAGPAARRRAGAATCGSTARTFAGDFISIDEALDKAAGLSGPVCLLDMGDNVGGGSPGDGTLLAHGDSRAQAAASRSSACAIRKRWPRPQAMGEWGTGTFRVGGKTDQLHGPPLECEATVVGLYDGQFEEPQPRHGGFTKLDQGRRRSIRTDHGLTIMLTSRRMPPFSLRQLTAHGILPERVSPARRQGGQRPGRGLQGSLQALHPRQHARRAPRPTSSSWTTGTAGGRCFRGNGSSNGGERTRGKLEF